MIPEILHTVSRVALGAFFVSSGYHKIFVPDVRTKFRGLFNRIGVASLWLPVALGELAGGMGVMTGTLTRIAAAGLFLILAGAIYLDVWQNDVVGKHPRDLADWFAKIVYCPEILMLWFLVTYITQGAGKLSVDAFLGL